MHKSVRDCSEKPFFVGFVKTLLMASLQNQQKNACSPPCWLGRRNAPPLAHAQNYFYKKQDTTNQYTYYKLALLYKATTHEPKKIGNIFNYNN